jgi:hypothetical protein
LNKCITLSPDIADYYEERGHTHYAMGNTVQAQTDFDKANRMRSQIATTPTLQTGEGPKPKTPASEGPQPDLLKSVELSAPALGREDSNIDRFAGEMRKLASDEFAFRDAKENVFWTIFSQGNLESSPTIKLTHGRNTVVYPPKYDFESKKVTLVLHWFYHHEEKKFSAGTAWPEITDSCAIFTQIELDEPTARNWKNAFDNGAFAIRLWFTPIDVMKADWRKNQGAALMPDGSLSHDIIINAKTHRYEFLR